MITVKQLIESGKVYLSQLMELGNQFPQESEMSDAIEATISTVESLNTELNKIANTKKKYVASGNFNMTGRIDLRPEMPLTLIIFGHKHQITINEATIKEQIKAIVYSYIPKDDVIYFDALIDIVRDVFTFDFVFQTDEIYKDGQDISIEIPALYALGYIQFQKIYLRGNKPDIDHNIYKWPLFGFSIPYAQSQSNQLQLLLTLTENIQPKGELADMRAFTLLSDEKINFAVNEFKTKLWTRIISPKAKWWLRNGAYLKY